MFRKTGYFAVRRRPNSDLVEKWQKHPDFLAEYYKTEAKKCKKRGAFELNCYKNVKKYSVFDKMQGNQPMSISFIAASLLILPSVRRVLK